MDFALMWCNERSGPPDYTEDNMLLLVRTIGERYFSQPNYLRAPDGRRILVISRPDRIVERLGPERAPCARCDRSRCFALWG